MSAPKPIQIVGGGLAGLTLGIALRKKEIPVTIFEAGNYPRHRVCGEFISGRGLDILDGLGLKQKFLTAGAIHAGTAAFFLAKSHSPARRLPVPALCLSRFIMDKLLADEFQKSGGELRTGERRSQSESREDVVRASGRRWQPVENSRYWFGLKAHARNVSLIADLEMHVFTGGYVGLCRLNQDEVNVCGLFCRDDRNESRQAGFNRLRGDSGTLLYERLASAVFDENSFCSVAGLSLRPQRALATAELCVGDALTMIPPVTGNGMSLALESAHIAAGPLAAFSRREVSWTQARQITARSCDRAFSRRLVWAKWLQRFMLTPVLQSPLLAVASRSNWFWRMAFEKTR